MKNLDEYEWETTIVTPEGNRAFAELNEELLARGLFDLSVTLVGIMIAHTHSMVEVEK